MEIKLSLAYRLCVFALVAGAASASAIPGTAACSTWQVGDWCVPAIPRYDTLAGCRAAELSCWQTWYDCQLESKIASVPIRPKCRSVLGQVCSTQAAHCLRTCGGFNAPADPSTPCPYLDASWPAPEPAVPKPDLSGCRTWKLGSYFCAPPYPHYTTAGEADRQIIQAQARWYPEACGNSSQVAQASRSRCLQVMAGVTLDQIDHAWECAGDRRSGWQNRPCEYHDGPWPPSEGEAAPPSIVPTPSDCPRLRIQNSCLPDYGKPSYTNREQCNSWADRTLLIGTGYFCNRELDRGAVAQEMMPLCGELPQKWWRVYTDEICPKCSAEVGSCEPVDIVKWPQLG